MSVFSSFQRASRFSRFPRFPRFLWALLFVFSAASLTSCDNAGQKNPNALLEGFSAASIAGAQRLVDEAMQLAGEVGHEEVFRRINEDQVFWNGASYVFALHARTRIVLANPVFPSNVGKHETELTDDAGNSLAALIDEASDDGAWVEYQWFNPETNQSARKVSWVKKTGDYVYGSGIYE